MTAIEAIYDKYKHMDTLFSDHEWMHGPSDDSDGSKLARTMAHFVYDLWQAVKTAKEDA